MNTYYVEYEYSLGAGDCTTAYYEAIVLAKSMSDEDLTEAIATQNTDVVKITKKVPCNDATPTILMEREV